MMSYTLYHARNLQPLASSISDLILAPEECLVWALDERTAQQMQQAQRGDHISLLDAQQYPLAANYSSVGSLDIRDKILVQDPFQRRGPYVLDRQIDATVRTFRKQSLQGMDRPELVEVHVAGDKIPVRRFYFAGDPQNLFQELREKGYQFEE